MCAAGPVGDGDVAGLPFNTIIPDIQSRTHREAADLILHRLALVDGGPDVVDIEADVVLRTHVVEAGESLDRLAGRYLGVPSRVATAGRGEV